MRVRLALLVLAAVALSGCINWQAAFDNAARNACLKNPDEGSRRACLDAADDNARARREDARKH